jgi:hypothetical protein
LEGFRYLIVVAVSVFVLKTEEGKGTAHDAVSFTQLDHLQGHVCLLGWIDEVNFNVLCVWQNPT